MSLPEIIYFTRCPEHGLYLDEGKDAPGCSTCFECGADVEQVPMIEVGGYRYDEHGPFDGVELVRWAVLYGHPEGWAKLAQENHARAERAEALLAALQREEKAA